MLTKEYQKVAVHALIRKGNKFLATLRSKNNDYKPEEWDLPGGTVEFGETSETALKREISEETKLKVEIIKPLFICSRAKDGRHQFWIVYECKYKSGEVKLNPDEHSDYLWADKNELEKLKKIYFLSSFYKKVLSKNGNIYKKRG